jgi:hypothetical protein
MCDMDCYLSDDDVHLSDNQMHKVRRMSDGARLSWQMFWLLIAIVAIFLVASGNFILLLFIPAYVLYIGGWKVLALYLLWRVGRWFYYDWKSLH